jgi:hypothetical protein
MVNCNECNKQYTSITTLNTHKLKFHLGNRRVELDDVVEFIQLLNEM